MGTICLLACVPEAKPALIDEDSGTSIDAGLPLDATMPEVDLSVDAATDTGGLRMMLRDSTRRFRSTWSFSI